MGMRRDSCSSEAKNFALRASLLMARQSPVSKDAGFLHAIIERDSLAHGNAQGFVFKRSEELCPAGKPPYGAPKPRVERRGVFARHNRKRLARAWECAGIAFERSEELCPEGKKWLVHLVFRYARSILSRSVYCFKLRYLTYF